MIIFLRSILNALDRFSEVEYRFDAFVVKILVVIRIRHGISNPMDNSTFVRSLSPTAIEVSVPQRIMKIFPPRSPVSVAAMADFADFA